MTGNLSLSRGWRLSGNGTSSVVSFLPGMERLSMYADMLSLPDKEEQPFSLPGLLPEGAALCLSREIPFGSIRCNQAILRFSCIRGKGVVLLDGKEIACFQNGALSLDLSETAQTGRQTTLTLAFDETRPAGVTGGVFLHCTEFATIGVVSLSLMGRDIRGEARIFGRAGKYRLLTYIQEVVTDDGDMELLSDPTQIPCMYPVVTDEQIVFFSLSGYEAIPVSLSLSLPHTMSVALVTLLVFREMTGGRFIPCDRHVLIVGKVNQMQAWIPLSGEEIQMDPMVLVEKLSELQITAVSLPSPPDDAFAYALRRKEIDFLLLPEDLKGVCGEGETVSFRREAYGDSLGELARQISGFLSCPVQTYTTLISDEMMQKAAFGKLPPDPGTVRERLLLLLIRLRLDGARRSLYSGPITPPGVLINPVFSKVLRDAAMPHAAAFPLVGGWWCGSVFSCRLFLINAPADSRGEAALRDSDGQVIAWASWQDMEMPVLTTYLPKEPCCLVLSLTLIPPDGPSIPSPELPVFVGQRGPLETAL